MGEGRIDSRGRLTLPKEIRDELNLGPGSEVIVEKDSRGILVKPVVSKKEFIKGLKGCITEKNQAEPLGGIGSQKDVGHSNCL